MQSRLGACLLLAALLHLWLVLMLGSAPPGTAAPGQGAWGALNVTLRGPAPQGTTTAPPPPAPPPPMPPPAGLPGTGASLRAGGTVRATATPPLPEPGAALRGDWAATPIERRLSSPPDPSAAAGSPPLERINPPAAMATRLPLAVPLPQSLPLPLPLPQTLPDAAPPAPLAAIQPAPAPVPAPASAPALANASAIPAARAPPAAPAAALPAPAAATAVRAEPVAVPAVPAVPDLPAAPALRRVPPLAPVAATTAALPPTPAVPLEAPVGLPALAAAPAGLPLAQISAAPAAPATPALATGRPDAGPQAGHDVATAPSAPASAPRLNLELARPRGGELSRQGSVGVLPLLSRPPELPDKLARDIDKAAKADCRKAYQGLGLLAVVPLAADALRSGKDGGCKW